MRNFKYLILLLFLGAALFAESKKQMVVLLGESEYHTDKTLPHFLNSTCKEDFDIHYIKATTEDRHQFKGIEKIAEADLLVLSVWRLALPKAHLNLIRDYVASDKPMWVLRTSTHGFALRPNQEVPVGSDQWPEFDTEVLGCSYNGHYSSSYMTDVRIEDKASNLVKDMNSFSVRSWLYKVQPLSEDTHVLLSGKARNSEKEPVAWTRTRNGGGKLFCTTLGHHEDFFSQEFQKLFYRSIYWCMGQDVSDRDLDFQFFNGFTESKVPFTGATLDARNSQSKLNENNVISRTLWLRPGLNYNVAFDLDLLRPALIWKGEGITEVNMAHGSYNLKNSSKKSKQGEANLPRPVGDVLMGLPLVAGVDVSKSKWHDPRTKLEDKKQLSHGPLPSDLGHWNGLYVTDHGPVLSYRVGKTEVYEQYNSRLEKGVEVLERNIQLKDSTEKLIFHLGNVDGEVVAFSKDKVQYKLSTGSYLNISLSAKSHASFVEHSHGIDLEVKTKEPLSVFYSAHANKSKVESYKASAEISLEPIKKLWDEEVIVKSAREPMDASAFVQEDIPLPYMNADRRNVRAADIAFFTDGRAAIVTFDGDVWLLKDEGSRRFVWKRYAAGLHEPQGIAIRNDEIFVFDRNGLIRLVDRDGNGEADFHENFCSLMIQGSETREFSMGLEVLKDGSFVVAKGGQRSVTVNPHAGAVIKVSADGKEIERLGHGFREPYIGIDPKTDEIFASDQQGHWVPTTPFHIVEKDQHYGYLPKFLNKSKVKVEEPNLFIPHPVLQSGAGILRVHSKKMGVFDQRIMYMGYSKPAVGLIDYSSKDNQQSAYYSLNEKFDFPLLKVAQSPKDGLLYLTGFKIWDSGAKRISGLCRIKPSKNFSLPQKSLLYKQGIRLDFFDKLVEDSILPTNVKLNRWNYVRASSYGSGYYKLDGNPGKGHVLFSSLTLSKDKRSIFIAIPEMKQSMQLGLSYSVKTDKGKVIQGDVYFSIRDLPEFKNSDKDFPEIDFEAGPIEIESEVPQVATVEFGKSVANRVGCVGCHSQTDKKDGYNGPPWKGLFHSIRKLKGGKKISADESYLKESILYPTKKVSAGYEPTMPPYAGLLSQVELDSIILYLKSMK